MATIYLLLGSNEGDRTDRLQTAIREIEQHCGVVIKKSSLYETAAWGLEDQPDFLNMVLKVRTHHTPETLLKTIQVIEQKLGRQRKVKWGQRTLDIDILFYGNEIIKTQHLIVPHPYMQERRFTLLPLQEIAPRLIHPILKKTITALLKECKDALEAKKLVSETL